MANFVIILLLALACLADQFEVGRMLEGTTEADETEVFRVDDRNELDNKVDKELFDEIDVGKGGDNAVESQVKFLDTTREALLRFAGDLRLRREKNVTNAFFKVVNGFEKEIANLQATLGRRGVNQESVKKVAELIKIASRDWKANTKILRALTAEGLFIAQQISLRGVNRTRRGGPRAMRGLSRSTRGGPRMRRDASQLSGAIAFLLGIQSDIGDRVFEEYLSVSGLVTLIFVIDDSGSMADDIKAAIAIATKIVRAKRDEEVDYILSPFNDPDTGPITVNNESEGEQFITALKRLRTHDGGDCPELVLQGITNALTSGPQPGSSMYVFTDAPPKNATAENIHDVLDMALDLDIPINFFSKIGCGKPHDVYDIIADQTSGLVYPLRTSHELRGLGRLVLNKLRGSVSVRSGGDHLSTRAVGNTRTVRNTRTVGNTRTVRNTRGLQSEYKVFLDDSIEDVTITVTTQNDGARITLLGPTGRIVTQGHVGLVKGAVYDISNPVPGVYKLIVPPSAGAHKYKINAVSGINIDFGYYFAYIPKGGRNRVPVPLKQPLQGVETVTFITVAGAELVKSKSLTLKVVGNTGIVYEHKILEPVGRSGVRFVIKFHPPPSVSFRLELHGKTKKGNVFVRTSTREDQAVAVILRQAHTPHSNILPRSQTTKLRIQIRRANVGDNLERYTLSMKDQRGYGRVLTKTAMVRRERMGFAQIVFHVPGDAPKGKLEQTEIYLTRKGDTKPIATLSFSLLIV